MHKKKELKLKNKQDFYQDDGESDEGEEDEGKEVPSEEVAVTDTDALLAQDLVPEEAGQGGRNGEAKSPDVRRHRRPENRRS